MEKENEKQLSQSDELLTNTMGKLEDAMVIGWTVDGDLYCGYTTSIDSPADQTHLLELVKTQILYTQLGVEE